MSNYLSGASLHRPQQPTWSQPNHTGIGSGWQAGKGGPDLSRYPTIQNTLSHTLNKFSGFHDKQSTHGGFGGGNDAPWWSKPDLGGWPNTGGHQSSTPEHPKRPTVYTVPTKPTTPEHPTPSGPTNPYGTTPTPTPTTPVDPAPPTTPTTPLFPTDVPREQGEFIADFEQANALWQQQNDGDYSFRLRASTIVGPSTIDVVVRNNEVASTNVVEQPDFLGPLEGVTIDEILNSEANTNRRLTFDPQTGVPSAYAVGTPETDGGFNIELSNYNPNG